MNNAIAWYYSQPNPNFGIGTIFAIMMVAGVIIMAFGIDQSGRVSEEWKNPAIVVGVLIVIAGVYACIRSYKTLEADKTSQVLNQSGIEYHHQGQVQSIHWRQLNTIILAQTVLVSSPNTSFTITERSSITGPKLQEKIKETQHQISGVPVRE